MLLALLFASPPSAILCNYCKRQADVAECLADGTARIASCLRRATAVLTRLLIAMHWTGQQPG